MSAPGDAPLIPAVSERSDPLEAVLCFGAHAARTGIIAGLVVGVLSHGAFGGRALAAPIEMQRWAVAAREQVHSFLWATYDVDLVKPAPKPAAPEPEKPKEPEPQSEPVAAPMPKINPGPREVAPAEPPPPAAQAGRVLTAPVDPDEPEDFTGDGFATGNADRYVGGVTAPAGTGTVATYNRAASTTGVPNSTGTGAPPPAPAKVDRSRPASVTSRSAWSSCPFPPEADVDQIDYATVTIIVTVRPDGTPRSVRVVNDPGHGFGRAARMCALAQLYTPALDRDGTPTTGTTAPINVTFTR